MSSKSKKSSANAAMTMSETGKAELASSEGFSPVPYNDIATNCTIGSGILLHKGECSPTELAKNYDPSAISTQFSSRLQEAEGYVRFYVRDTLLPQDQFDALTSYVFNVGVGNARDALDLANGKDNSGVADEMKLNVNIRVKSKDGKTHLKKSHGLALRRERESAPFAPAVPVGRP